MLSDRVFHSILPLNGRELCPYEDVFNFWYLEETFYSLIIA